MRPVAAKIEGFRRFGSPNRYIDLTDDLIAVVGPNEAGKTSFLEGLVRLEDDKAVKGLDLTRGGSGRVRIQAVYELDDADCDRVTESLGPDAAAGLRKIRYVKREDGQRYYELEPGLPAVEDLLQARLQRVRALLGPDPEEMEESDAHEDLFPRIRSLVAKLESGTTLTEEGRSEWETIAAELQAQHENTDEVELGDALLAVVQVARHDLNDAVAGLLLRRRPSFLIFEERDRDLKAVYPLLTDKNKVRNRALDNVLAIAGTSVDELAAAANDSSKIRTVLREPNEQLRWVMEETWSQSHAPVELDIQGSNLHVNVFSSSQYIPIANRSAGIRQFVALVAFVSRYSTVGGARPVLLIDEAEQHLHYDAQADLVQVLARQEAASKVIYTTHSAGCLPPDLGRGVRAIETVQSPGNDGTDDPDWSRPSNNVWASADDDLVGFDPLLMSMGATTFAFTATRRAVVVEGITDAMLYPTLFREASGEKSLGYQFVPGLAEAADSDLPKFDRSAGTVAYLVDGDDSGTDLQDRLTRNGVEADRIMSIGNGTKPITVEDLIDREVFLTAVNVELESRSVEAIPADKLPEHGRWRAVEKWVEGRTGDPRGGELVCKRAVANRVLYAPVPTILSAGYLERLASLHRDLTRVLG